MTSTLLRRSARPLSMVALAVILCAVTGVFADDPPSDGQVTINLLHKCKDAQIVCFAPGCNPEPWNCGKAGVATHGELVRDRKVGYCQFTGTEDGCGGFPTVYCGEVKLFIADEMRNCGTHLCNRWIHYWNAQHQTCAEAWPAPPPPPPK